MFTGIIAAVGSIAAKEMRDGDLRLQVRSGKLDLADVQLGDSIATNGVCLTVVALPGDGFWADVSLETLALSSLANAQVGDSVNLEKALTLATRLGGHLVSGHVDGLAEVVSRKPDGRSERFRLKAPAHLAKYIAHKGSVCIDGASLTVNKVDGAEFELNIVPHTVQETIIKHYKPGTQVNLEVDQVARYLERLMLGEQAAVSDTITGGVTKALLAEHGFYKA
ncbi:riboflavin synthase [Dasania marina]|uniref:riboflavin synthase n=1 Tax=Dasania marina TaxID=471499 RepID=UPI0030DD7041|tara:strand:- start:20914 stop:21582 length:669 start_codon:yes stop_codon:yes gene_type:complete